MSDDPLLGALLSDSRPLVRQLFDEPLLDDSALAAQVAGLEADIRRDGARPHALVDAETGLALVDRARGLLSRRTGLDHRGRRLVQVAIRYLVIDDDGDADLDSPFGFDDDREVFDAVERALGSPG